MCWLTTTWNSVGTMHICGTLVHVQAITATHNIKINLFKNSFLDFIGEYMTTGVLKFIILFKLEVLLYVSYTSKKDIL